jgi:structural maintenance of chromosome 4
MKPKALNENEEGMLEYLEDIIGSSRLKAPIEELSVQIEQLMEERSAQVNTCIGIINHLSEYLYLSWHV